MNLGGLDQAIIVGSLGLSLVLGLALGKRGGRSVSEYFVAGRKLSWWLAGTSIVATSFAADTPLAIARIVRSQGLAGNWYWWSGALAFVFCMFFFAPLWRRARLVTDVELIELRYTGRPAATLRGVQGLYRALLVNGITMGWVVLGMQKICTETFGWPRLTSMVLLMALAVGYTALSGLWGVVLTDLFQFGLAMFGSVALMVAVLVAAGGPSGLVAALVDLPATAANGDISAVASGPALLGYLPAGGDSAAIATLVFFLTLQWWGGAEGGGFLAQRLFATRDERHAVFALLWFSIAHFALRSWPWIVVGLASVIFLPDLVDPETAYPKMMIRFLPPGLLGLMVASLLAAFMSTISTHLNWGASYLVSDIWRRFVRPEASEKQLVRAGRVFAVAMALLAGLMAWSMDSILGAWLYLAELGAGAVLISLLRWYWWRINAWSEIAALVASLVTANGLRLLPLLAPAVAPLAEDSAWYPVRFALVLAVGTAAGLAATLRTRPVPDATLDAFYRRVRPAGVWGPVAARCPDVAHTRVGLPDLAAWLLGVAVVYAALFGVGDLLLDRPGRGVVVLAGGALAALGLWRVVKRLHWFAAVAGEAEASG